MVGSVFAGGASGCVRQYDLVLYGLVRHDSGMVLFDAFRFRTPVPCLHYVRAERSRQTKEFGRMIPDCSSWVAA
jgi:hypothetical protein